MFIGLIQVFQHLAGGVGPDCSLNLHSLPVGVGGHAFDRIDFQEAETAARQFDRLLLSGRHFRGARLIVDVEVLDGASLARLQRLGAERQFRPQQPSGPRRPGDGMILLLALRLDLQFQATRGTVPRRQLCRWSAWELRPAS